MAAKVEPTLVSAAMRHGFAWTTPAGQTPRDRAAISSPPCLSSSSSSSCGDAAESSSATTTTTTPKPKAKTTGAREGDCGQQETTMTTTTCCAERSPTTALPSPSSLPESDDGLPRDARWACGVCKRTNVATVSTCQVCGTDRAYRRESSKLDADSLEYHGFRDLEMIGEALGTGTFGTVHLAFSKRSQSAFAVKVLSKRTEGVRPEGVRSECAVARDLLGPHARLVRFFDLHETKNTFYVITEFLAGGELFARLCKRGKYGEFNARLAAWQILDAIEFMHSRYVAHRDIKPENILLKSRRNDVDIKLCDFGLAARMRVDSPDASFDDYDRATPEYAAPEIFRKERYGPKVDVWSLGVVTYVLLTGALPFPNRVDSEQLAELRTTRLADRARSVDSLDTLIDTGSSSSANHSNSSTSNPLGAVTPRARAFLRDLLADRPRDRPTALIAREHAWFSDAIDDLAHSGENPRVLEGLRKLHANRKLKAVVAEARAAKTTAAAALAKNGGVGGSSSSSPLGGRHDNRIDDDAARRGSCRRRHDSSADAAMATAPNAPHRGVCDDDASTTTTTTTTAEEEDAAERGESESSINHIPREDDERESIAPGSRFASLDAWLAAHDLHTVDLSGWCECVDDLAEFDDDLCRELFAERPVSADVADRFRRALGGVSFPSPARAADDLDRSCPAAPQTATGLALFKSRPP